MSNGDLLQIEPLELQFALELKKQISGGMQLTNKSDNYVAFKGHSVTRKLGSDGQVDTVQTLHNLNEDELGGFEQAWKGNNDRHLHGLNDALDFPGNSGQLASWGGFPDPFRAHSSGVQRAQPSGGRPKKIVNINVE